MTTLWRKTWRGLALRIETDETEESSGAGTGARSLSVGPSDESDTWLRFHPFSAAPCWSISSTGSESDVETRPLDERGDPVSESIEILEADILSLIERATGQSENVSARETADVAVLLAAERALRHRPAILDELDPVVLRNRRSEKWHTYPSDVLPVWVAEMDFPIAAPIQDELRRFVESGDVGYPIGLRETGLPDVFCERMREGFGWSPDPARVEILSEVVQGMYVALEAFSEPGQGIAVQTPIYPPFLGSIRDTGRELIDNPMLLGDAGMTFDLDGLASTITPETRMLLFCNPHNPSGRVYRRDELERLAEIAVEHDLVVVSDEIHGDLLFDGRTHIPLATVGPEIARRTITLTSASKAFNIPGLRTAIAHFGDPALQRRFNTVLPRHARGGIGLFGLYATMAAWRWAQPWLDEVVPYLAENRVFAERALAERIPEIGFIPPEATYLAWLDCRALDLRPSPSAHFLQHGRVALSEGRAFGEAWAGFARLNLATSRPILAEAIDRMSKALGH